jgi:transposase
MCYELTDHEWSAIKPMLPNKVRGVRRVDDRRLLNGIFWVLRSGAPWRDPAAREHHIASDKRQDSKRKILRRTCTTGAC